MASRGVAGVRVGSGGAELVAYQLARALVEDGHDVTLIEDVADDLEAPAGLTIVPVESRLLRVLQRSPRGFLRWLVQHLVGNIAVARAARRLLAEHDFDLVHAHGNLAAILIAHSSSVPVLYTEHDATPWSCRYRRWWERAIRKAVYRVLNVRAFRRVAAVVAIFDELRVELTDRWGISPEKVFTAVNGTDLNAFHPERAALSAVRRRADSPRYCLFVGRLTPRKAPDLLLRALAEVPGVRCAFVGDGPMRRKLEALALELELDDRVAFFGSLPASELATVYAQADFLVLPSVSEGTPLVILEAMASGIPVLSTRIAGTPHLVKDWETGFVVKPGDVGQLAMGIKFLHGDNALRARMGETARVRAQSQFPWASVARHYESIYDTVAHREQESFLREAPPVVAGLQT